MKSQVTTVLAVLLVVAGCGGRVEAAEEVTTPALQTQTVPRLRMISTGTLAAPAGSYQRGPALAYGGGVYLLVWQDGFNGLGGKSDILGLRISEEGRPIDKKAIEICVADGVQDRPAVAFSNGKFIVLWSDFRSGKEYEVRAAFVDTEGRVTSKDEVVISSGPGARAHPAVASAGGKQFLAVWQDFRGGDHFAVYGTRIAADTGEVLDKDGLLLMDRGERPRVIWTGANYVVSQRWTAAVVGPDGKVLVPANALWASKDLGRSCSAAAWGKAFLFLNTEPYPDPWGWGGNGAIVGVSMSDDGQSPERGWSAGIRDMQSAKADGRLKNCLDATQWRNHPGWPMGMRGGLKGTHDDTWVSGQPAAVFNGRSLLVVWPRARLVDNRRLARRELYLCRVLPDWGLVDRPPARVFLFRGFPDLYGETTAPVLCAGATGNALLAYERSFPAHEDPEIKNVMPELPGGVVIEFCSLSESEDREAPKVAYLVPVSDTESIVAFDEPVDPAGASDAKNFRVEGLAVKSAAFNADPRGLQREVILTTEPPVRGKTYTLRVTGVKDRSPRANASAGEAVEFIAKPGTFLRGEFIERWAVLGALKRNVAAHPFDPAAIRPSPGEAGPKDSGVRWAEMKGPVVDFGEAFGEKGDLMAYASTYVYSDRPREALLRLDTNDHNRAWLNGRVVNDGITGSQQNRAFHDYSDQVSIQLGRGWNQLLVQVENRMGAWLLVAQITDAGRVPIRDLTWQTNDPDKH